MSILDEIVSSKREEVRQRKARYSPRQLRESGSFSRETVSIREALLRNDKPGIIAEFKRRSPSRGMINEQAMAAGVTAGYIEAGAVALSVLTDKGFFGGGLGDLAAARAVNDCPILRKDFIIDEYQVYESRAAGADVILLIAAILDSRQVAELAACAGELGMEVLLEIHTGQELDHICKGIGLVGVNNRNLQNFRVDKAASRKLAPMIPAGPVRVSESGISEAGTMWDLYRLGYRGFLIGEYFMAGEDPAGRCRRLVGDIEAEAGH